MAAFDTDSQAAKAVEDYRRGQASPIRGDPPSSFGLRQDRSSPTRRAALKFLCALPWSEAERQGASMAISR